MINPQKIIPVRQIEKEEIPSVVLKLSNRVKYLLDKSSFNHEMLKSNCYTDYKCLQREIGGCNISPWNAISYE